MQEQDSKYERESHTRNGVGQLFKSIVTKYHFSAIIYKNGTKLQKNSDIPKILRTFVSA
jgi:hypothetical protein